MKTDGGWVKWVIGFAVVAILAAIAWTAVTVTSAASTSWTTGLGYVGTILDNFGALGDWIHNKWGNDSEETGT